MTCSYCRFQNAEAEHRCRRCGRPLGDVYAGATQGSLARVPDLQPRAVTASAAAPAPALKAVAPVSGPRQERLFQDEPSTSLRSIEPKLVLVEPGARTVAPAKAAKAKPVRATGERELPLLDHLKPAPPAPRKLSTTVEAVIYCEAPVASPMHRASAAAIDCSMIMIACAAFFTIYFSFGGVLAVNKVAMAMFAAAAVLIAGFYGFVWVWAGRPSHGMNATKLVLINFDGFPPETSARWLRFGAAVLSICAGCLGVLWAIFDEEQLSWHDHISKTFPTPRETDNRIVRG